MKKIINILFFICMVICTVKSAFASNVLYGEGVDRSKCEYKYEESLAKAEGRISKYDDVSNGPGNKLKDKKKNYVYEDNSKKIESSTKSIIDIVKSEKETDQYKDSKISRKIIAPENMRIGEGSGSGNGNSWHASDTEDKNNGSKKVRIQVVAGRSGFNEKFVYFTDAETLTELMNEKGLTSDAGFIYEICGIEVYEPVVDEDGKWEGWYWELFVNGKHSNVGADDVILKNGTMITWKESYGKVTW